MGLTVMVGSICTIILVFFIASPWICPSLWGSYSLGKNLYMVVDEHSFQKGTERCQGYMILQGSQMEGRVCHGGSYIIPMGYENRYDSMGEIREHVLESRYNDDWIIVKTYIVKKDRYQYYFIKLDFDEKISADEIISKHVQMYSDSISFIDACKKHHVDLEF